VFTGLVKEVGVVRAAPHNRAGGKLAVRCPQTAPTLTRGASIAVNGACLTCEEVSGDGFASSVLAATYLATNLGSLQPGEPVNLEPALRAGDPIGGHFLQGHVDCTVRVLANGAAGGGDWTLTCELPEELAPMVFPGASVGLNGVSLTVRTVEAKQFAVNLVPVTLAETNLGGLRPGMQANLEVDLITKSTYYAVSHLQQRGKLNLEELARLGYGRKH